MRITIKAWAIVLCMLPFICLSQQSFNSTRPTAHNLSAGHYQPPSNHTTEREIVGTIVWLGITSDWDDVQNWHLSTDPEYGLPTLNTDVLIGTVASGIYPVIPNGQVATCNKVTIMSGGPNLTVSAGADLNCFGDFINYGTLTNKGRINLIGVDNQAFPGPGTINVMSVLQISKTAGTVTVNNDFYIDSALLPTSGVLHLGDHDITLKSTPAHTAYVGIVGSTTGFTYDTGRFVVQRYISQTRKWQLLSVPTNGPQSIMDAWQDGGSSTTSPTGFGVQITGPNVSNGIDAFSYSASMMYQSGCSPYFTPVTNTLDTLTNPQGYFIYVYGDRGYGPGTAGGPSTTLQSRGKLFVGNHVAEDHPPAVTAAADITTGEDHMSVSNPFASPINFTSLYNLAANSNGNFKSNFKVWDPSQPGLYGSGIYQTITGPTGWLATPGGGSMYDSGVDYSVIQSGQAFLVEADSSGTVSVQFDESVKSVQSRLANRGNYFDRLDPAQISMLSSFIYSAAGKLLDGNRIVLDMRYSNDIDDNDASKYWNQDANFAIWKNNKSLSVETRPAFAEGDTIRYELYGLYEGNYQLRLDPQLVNAPGLDVFLIDRYLNNESAINLASNNVINFTVNTDPASNAADRFYLVVRKKPVVFSFQTVSANWLMQDDDAQVDCAVANQQEVLYFELQRGETASNLQTIGQPVVMSGSTYSFVDEAPLAKDNFYRIKAVLRNGSFAFSEPVLLVHDRKEAVVISPNPVIGSTVRLAAQNFANGTYVVQVWNASGSLIQQEKIQVTSSQMNLSIRLRQYLPAGTYQLCINEYSGKKLSQEKLVIQ